MMFVFGIVGPLKWMYWWGLFITFADVLIALRLEKAGDAKSVVKRPERN